MPYLSRVTAGREHGNRIATLSPGPSILKSKPADLDQDRKFVKAETGYKMTPDQN